MSDVMTRVYRYSKESHKDIRFGTLYSVLNKIFDLAPELLIGVAVDLVVQKQNSWIAHLGIETPLYQLLFLGGITFCVWACESFFQYLSAVRWKNAAQKLQHSMRMDAYGHIQKLDVDWLNKSNVGMLQTVLNDDINQLERFINSGLDQIVQMIASTILVGCVFLYISPLLALGTMVPIPLILLAVFYFQKKVEPRYALVREKAGRLGASIETNLTGMSIIKSFTAETFRLKKMEKESVSYRKANERAITLASAFVPMVRILVLLGFLFTLMLGGWFTFNGHLPVGSYSVLIFLTQRFLWPFTRLGEALDNFSRSKASSKRVFELLDTPINIEKEESKQFSKKDFLGDLIFEDVSFSYGEKKLFSHLSLKIPHNKMTAFVGSTGSGKSTLIKIILRFYEATSGKVLVGGRSLKDFPVKDVRESISYVSQDSTLFPGSLLENIAFGDTSPNLERVKEAARVARAEEFIEKLPYQYETEVGERGYRLSGGQKQRITIARALYKKADYLIFDEATSNIDNKTEVLIQEALEEISKKITTIVIAHRLSTIKKADQIYVLEEGKVLEEGNHESLLAKKGVYEGLWNVQK